MRLTEAEGKTILKESGLNIPEFFLVVRDQEAPKGVSFPAMVKAQTLLGGRGKAGLVKEAADDDELTFAIQSVWKSSYEKRPFNSILIESKVQSAREYYLSCVFDTASRGPAIILSKFGGMDIEVVAKRQPEAVIMRPVNILKGLGSFDYQELFEAVGVKKETQNEMRQIIEKIYHVFKEQDAELVEINPLIENTDGQLIIVDCKMILDDAAFFRHDFNFPKRTGFRELTEMEIQAREIDARTHRGVVGRTFLELDGNIGFMSSGGGASITCLDALLKYNGRPANFTEYSGNPEREDVKDLAKLVLSKPDLKGLWVVGPTANFTDIYETLGGIVDALVQVNPSYPIVIRRAGPRDDEAKKMIEEIAAKTNLDITFFGEEVSMTESAKILIDKIGVNL